MRDVLRFWLTFEEEVGRGAYVRHGTALVALKYAVDVGLVATATGTMWTPFDYLQPAPLLLSDRLAEAPGWLPPAMAIWTLPFLWIGVTLTMRRLIDVGRSAWWALLFFVPLASYLLILALAVAPGSVRSAGHARPRAAGAKGRSALVATGAGVLVGMALLWLGVIRIESYGLAVFMGTPFGIGMTTGYVFRWRHEASSNETLGVVTGTVLLVGATAFVTGFEGFVCLLMILPLGLVVALMGGIVGHRLAVLGEGPLRGFALVALLLPGGAAIEARDPSASLREVTTSITIQAPPDRVWDEVVDFSPIPEPTSLLFRLGIAYPTHAEIEGAGVGAVRYCVFSTGAFVEPITVWEPGVRLGFDVVESPRPLEELSYRPVAPPHLDGYLAPRRGEFRLVDLGDGRTRLEGSTWYEQRLRPEGYWIVFSDYVIGRIHERVLRHIGASVESATEGRP